MAILPDVLLSLWKCWSDKTKTDLCATGSTVLLPPILCKALIDAMSESHNIGFGIYNVVVIDGHGLCCAVVRLS